MYTAITKTSIIFLVIIILVFLTLFILSSLIKGPFEIISILKAIIFFVIVNISLIFNRLLAGRIEKEENLTDENEKSRIRIITIRNEAIFEYVMGGILVILLLIAFNNLNIAFQTSNVIIPILILFSLLTYFSARPITKKLLFTSLSSNPIKKEKFQSITRLSILIFSLVTIFICMIYLIA